MPAVHYHTGVFPPEDRLERGKLIPLIDPAAAALARYDGLLGVSRADDWTGWCRFFLEAVRLQAEENLAKAQEILRLYDRLKSRVVELTRSRYAIHALDWIFDRPIFRGADFVNQEAIPSPSARRILNALRDGGILETAVEGSGRRAAILMFPDLLAIAEGKEMS